MRAQTLREIAKRNDYPLPDRLESLHRFRDFRHFIEVFELRMGALQTYDDFRRVVVEYAAEAASHGAAYLEGIFSPGLWRGLDQDEVFGGCCDGAQEARQLYDVDVRLTPDLPGAYSREQAEKVATFAAPTCARAWSPRSRTIRCRASSPWACAARSRRTILRCSTLASS